jgi:hypothetical protein
LLLLHATRSLLLSVTYTARYDSISTLPPSPRAGTAAMSVGPRGSFSAS